MAPAGGDSLAVLLPVPNLRADVDWERAADTAARSAGRRSGEPVRARRARRDRSVVEHRMAPPDFAREFGAVDGNAFAVEPTLHQSAYFRAPNRVGPRRLPRRRRYASRARGSPGVLLGAQVTASLVAQDVRR